MIFPFLIEFNLGQTWDIASQVHQELLKIYVLQKLICLFS